MIELIDRRLFLAGLGAAGLAGLSGPAFAAPGGFVMWHSPGCGCCLEWARRMEAAFGRRLPVVEVADIAQVKRAQGVPQDLQSCHTALVGGYAVEGHVPPADIKRLIASKSRIVRGLAVPGMPAGSPGMEGPPPERYAVLAFAPGGATARFASH